MDEPPVPPDRCRGLLYSTQLKMIFFLSKPENAARSPRLPHDWLIRYLRFRAAGEPGKVVG